MGSCEEQENELSLLKAMYQENELRIGIPSKNFDEEEVYPLSSRCSSNSSLDKENEEIAFSLKVKCSDSITINLDVQFPQDYPAGAYPYVNIRSGKVNEENFRKNLRTYIKSNLEFGMPMVLEIVAWLAENYEHYVLSESNVNRTPTQHVYARFWIYSHHLYSPTKRKNLKNHSKRLDLCGFSMPGKPSVIVVEGSLDDCEEFWSIVRSWSWQDIALKYKETSKDRGFLKLPKFFELVPQTTGVQAVHKHADCSVLKSKLREFGLEENFSYLIEI